MDVSIDFLTGELQKKDIRPSYQRIKVLEYMHQKGGHPTVDEIYHVLSPEIPSLSKTTIYNTLHTFVEAGLIRAVNIDGAEQRYDLMLFTHGHFKCDSCGTITNFSIDIDCIAPEELNEFDIRERNVYFRGLCPNCCVTRTNQINKEK